MPFIAIALVIAAALGGGTAAVAQASLPGDALWGFKVNINEGLAGALSASDQARADWDLTTIETRLNESQRLSAKGQLSPEAQNEITTNIQAHVQGITGTITKLQAQGDAHDAASIAARYQAELAAAADSSVSAGSNISTTVKSALESASTLSASVDAMTH